MIEAIHILNLATFDRSVHSIDNLSKLNFFYGSNGSGKTTISRVIADSDAFPSCRSYWVGERLQTLVYNRDFVDRNFSPASDLKGIFTLGEENVNTLEKK